MSTEEHEMETRERMATLETMQPEITRFYFEPYLGRDDACRLVMVSKIAILPLDLVLERRRSGDSIGWVIREDERCGWFRDPIEALASVINVSWRTMTGDDDDYHVVRREIGDAEVEGAPS